MAADRVIASGRYHFESVPIDYVQPKSYTRFENGMKLNSMPDGSLMKMMECKMGKKGRR